MLSSPFFRRLFLPYLLVICAAFYVGGFRPQAAKQARLALELQKNRRDLEANQDKATDLPKLTQRVEKLQAFVELNGKKLPMYQIDGKPHRS